MLQPVKIYFNNEDKIQIFSNQTETNPGGFTISRLSLRKILKDVLQAKEQRFLMEGLRCKKE